MAQCDCACATLLALPSRYCCDHEFLASLLLRFRCASSTRRFRYVNFEQGQHKRSEASDTLLLRSRRFYCAVAISAKIYDVLTEISKRSGIAIQ